MTTLYLRCSVCQRILGRADAGAVLSTQRMIYCADRTCYLYPATSRALAATEDPTVSAWVYGIHCFTDVPLQVASRAAGRGPSWGRNMVAAVKKRWKTAY